MTRRRGQALVGAIAMAVVAVAIGISGSGTAQATVGWSPTGSMTTSRYGSAAVLLPSGKVLIVGGFYGAQSAELYDPATDTFTATPNMSIERVNGMIAVLLPSGKVLVAGGQQNGGADTNTAELYDPAANTWTPTGSMKYTRTAHTA